MPSKSEAQRKALYAKKGSAWVHAHGFDKLASGAKKTYEPDPKPVKKKKKGKK